MSDLTPANVPDPHAAPAAGSTRRRARIPVYIQIAAWAVPLLVLTQFSLVAALPLAVLAIGVLADSRARLLRIWTAVLGVTYVAPLLIWILRPDPAQSMSKDMHPVFYVLIAAAGLALLIRMYVRRPRRA